MASFDTLLSRVRSETPISFFLVVSNVAFFGLAAAPSCARARVAPPDLSLGRLLIPYDNAQATVSTEALFLSVYTISPCWAHMYGIVRVVIHQEIGVGEEATEIGISASGAM